MKKETISWQIIILILGILLIMTLREFLNNNNKINALNSSAKCIGDFKRSFVSADQYSACVDIRNYYKYQN